MLHVVVYHSLDSHGTPYDRMSVTVVHNRGLDNANKVTYCVNDMDPRKTHFHSFEEICGHTLVPTVVNHATNHHREYNTRFTAVIPFTKIDISTSLCDAYPE